MEKKIKHIKHSTSLHINYELIDVRLLSILILNLLVTSNQKMHED